MECNYVVKNQIWTSTEKYAQWKSLFVYTDAFFKYSYNALAA
jgi:hypothetical protein